MLNMEEAGYTPNKLFREARKRLFGARAALAEAANLHLPPGFAMNANDIGKIERGIVTYPRSPRRSALRKALRAETDVEIGLFDSRQTVAGAHSVSNEIVAQLDVGQLGNWTMSDPLIQPGFQSINEESGGSSDQEQKITRAIRGLDHLTIETPVPPTIGWADVEHVRYITSTLALSENKYGGGFSGQAAAAQLRYSAKLIGARSGDDVRRAMFDAIGNLSGVVGFLAFDVADFRSARICFDFELWCAEQSKSWSLRANALSDMARLAIYIGRSDDALSLIELAQVRSDRLSASMRAMLSTIRARLLAAGGRDTEAWAEVARADGYFADRNVENEPPWISYYDDAEHYGSTGRALIPCALKQRDPKYVAPRLEKAIRLHDEQHPRSRTFSRTRLASLIMKVGDPREGAAIGHVALQEATALRSSRLRSEIKHLASISVAHHTISEVAGLIDSIEGSSREDGDR